ncbi:helix-turn-helix domain-containing protein [Acidobacteriota bacterium]
MSLQNRIRAYHKIISEGRLGNDPASLQKKVGLVQDLENELKTEFKDTKDFQNKVEAFLLKEEMRGGYQLRIIRQKKKWSAIQLAYALNISVPYLSRMENNLRPLNKKALRFVQDFELTEKNGRRTESPFLRRLGQKIDDQQ